MTFIKSVSFRTARDSARNLLIDEFARYGTEIEAAFLFCLFLTFSGI